MTAAVRKTPTVANGGSDDGTLYTNAVDAEVEALWKVAATWLTSIAGTGDAITASSDTSLVAAITAYARPMAFWYKPVNANTTAVTMDIDSVGVISVNDQFNAAMQGGEFSTSGIYLLMYDGTQLRAIGTTAGAANRPSTAPDVIANDTKSSGTDAGTFTSGAYRLRTLNTLVRNNISASLGSNQITLGAGTYYVEWSCPACNIQNHKSRLFNATDSAIIALGTTEHPGSGAQNVQTRSIGSAYFTLTGSKALQLEHRGSNSESGDGFGNACAFGDDEIYAEIRIWKQ